MNNINMNAVLFLHLRIFKNYNKVFKSIRAAMTKILFYICIKVAQWCLTLCDAMDCSPPGSSFHGILQARIVEWITMLSSKGSSWPREWTQVSCIWGRFFTVWATRKVKILLPRCFISNKPLFLIVLEVRNSKILVPADSVSGENTLPHWRHFSHWNITAKRPRGHCGVPLIKVLIQSHDLSISQRTNRLTPSHPILEFNIMNWGWGQIFSL